MSTLAQQFSTGSLASGLTISLGLAAQYGLVVGVSRVLGPQAAGQFFVLLSLSQFLALLGRGGLEKLGLKHVAVLEGRGADTEVRRLVRSVVVRVFFLSAALAGAAYVARPLALRLYDLDAAGGILAWFILLIPFAALAQTYSYMLRGLRLIGRAGVVQAILPYGCGLIALGFTVEGPHPATPLVVGLLVGSLASAVLGQLWVSGALRARAPRAPGDALLPPNWSEGAPYFLGIAILAFFSSSVTGLDVLIVGAVTNAETVALYVAASRTVFAASIGLRVLNNILEPLVASAFARGEGEVLQGLVWLSARWSLASNLIIGGCIVILAKPLLGLFGPEYGRGEAALYILVVGQLVNSATGPVSLVMQMTGAERQAALIFAGVLGVMIPSYALAAWWGGVTGAALVTALGRSSQWLIMVGQVRRLHGISTYVILRELPLVVGIVVLAIGLRLAGTPFVAATSFGVTAAWLVWRYLLLGEDRRLIRATLGLGQRGTASVG